MAQFKLAESGRDNNFNLIRFLAALGVIYSHAFLLSLGDPALEPLEASTGYTLGDHAVNVFFVLSGFLVSKSLLTRRDVVTYMISRAARVLPGLIVAALVTAFIIGPIVTSNSLSGYFSSPAVWSYPLMIGMVASDPLGVVLPGVFDTNPFPVLINGPLWTIRYEVMAYGTLMLLAMAGVFTTPRRFAIFFGVAVIGLVMWLFADNDWSQDRVAIDHITRLGFLFTLGAAAYRLRKSLSMTLFTVVSLGAITWLLSDTVFYRGALYFATAAAVLWFAQKPAGKIRHFNRAGDYSYGLYIYGWPVAQSVMVFLPALAPILLFAIGAPIALALAIASWTLIEKPALAKAASWCRSPGLDRFRFLIAACDSDEHHSSQNTRHRCNTI